MLNMREIEAQAKALAPVLKAAIGAEVERLRQEFAASLEERDAIIRELTEAVQQIKQVDPEEIALQAAELIDKPKDGKDADPEEIKRLVEAAVAEIPRPQDGKSVDPEEVARMANEEVLRHFDAIQLPKDGKDYDPEVLRQAVADEVAKIPVPKDGASVTVDDVAPMIRDEVAKAVAAAPPAKDGQSVTADDVRPMLEQLVDDAVKALPPAEPGKDADMDALRSHLGELVKSIQLPAAPTVEEVAATFERRFSDLTLSWERQARDAFEKAADRMPRPKDGRDALPLESFDLSLGEDGRTITVKMQAGETVIEKSVKMPALIDRGVFSAEKAAEYEKGDGTTYGGCYWIAQKDAPEGVPGGSADWRLAVKKGRDGKDLRDNASRHDPDKGVSIK